MRDTTTTTGGRTDATVKATSGFNLGIGLWLIIAPFVLPYDVFASAGVEGVADATATWNDIVVGLLVVVLAGLRLAQPVHSEWAGWTNCGLGAWLIVAPFVLGLYPIAATWNDVVCGILITVLAAISASAARKARRVMVRA